MTTTPENFTVATYNIHRCIGLDDRHDPERIAAIINGLGADAVALQEIDSAVDHRYRIDQLRFLARATGMEPVAGPAVRRAYGHYGNGLLSRLPVLTVERHDLSVARREPRAALVVDLEADAGPIRLVTTHLGLDRRERLGQLHRLLGLLDDSPDRPLEVLAGDFNDPWRRSRLSRSLQRAFGFVPTPRSYPARRPLLPLDRIYVRPPARLEVVDTVRSRSTAIASDHLPLRARISTC